MREPSFTRKLAGFLAIGFALAATGYLAFKEHKQANPEPAARSADVIPQAPVVAEELEAEPVLDELGFPIDVNTDLPFLYSSKSLVISPEALEPENEGANQDVFLPSSKFAPITPQVLTPENETIQRDHFLPSSKVLYIKTDALIEPATADDAQPIEN